MQENSSKRILITGGTGFLGSALSKHLQQAGYEIYLLSRSKQLESCAFPTINWDPLRNSLQSDLIEDFHAIIHLAGENISKFPWSEKQKRQIITSRVQGTTLLCDTISKLKRPPQVLITASAVGYYGNNNDICDENTPQGNSFLANCCAQWEKATNSTGISIRTINARFGVIISFQGGMVAKLKPIYRLGLGAILGSGTQMLSWIALDDCIRAIEFLLNDQSISGPVNVTSPFPISNEMFCKQLAFVLNRPLLFRVPNFFLNKIGGDFSKEVLLANCQAIPAKLLNSGFHFSLATIEEALTAPLFSKKV